MARRCCCGCPAGEIRFSDPAVVFLDANDDPVDPSTIVFDMDGNAQLPIGFSAVIRVPGVTRLDAWEFVLGFWGGIDVEADYRPATANTAKIPGAVLSYSANASFNVSYDSTTSGGTVDPMDQMPIGEMLLLSHLLYRNTPKYVAAQNPIHGPSLYAMPNGNPRPAITRAMQMGVVEKQLSISGWIRITATEPVPGMNYARISYVKYAGFARQWVGGYYYGGGEFVQLCQAPTPFNGSVYEVFQDHTNFQNVVFGTATADSPFSGPFTLQGNFSHPYCYAGDQATVFANDGNPHACGDDQDRATIYAMSRIDDPDPDPVTGDLWPAPRGRVAVSSCITYECRIVYPNDSSDPCSDEGFVPQPAGTPGEFVTKSRSTIALIPLETYRLGWTVVVGNNAENLCHPNCSSPTEYGTAAFPNGPTYDVIAEYRI